MSDTPTGPVVIVGAGMAGLGAALTLRRAGREVIVLERLGEVGGLARSVEFRGTSSTWGRTTSSST